MSRRNQKQKLWHRQGGRCHYCQIEMRYRTNPLKDYTATIDHLKPKSKSGTNSIDNLVLACKRCNEMKGSKTEKKFLELLRLAGAIGTWRIYLKESSWEEYVPSHRDGDISYYFAYPRFIQARRGRRRLLQSAWFSLCTSHYSEEVYRTDTNLVFSDFQQQRTG